MVGYHSVVSVRRFLGVDLAWSEGRDGDVVNETGLVCLDRSGYVLDAAWARGVADTLTWIRIAAGDQSALLFVDAPLVVDNPSGQRECERQVGQHYGRWQVSANSTNQASRHLAGVTLRQLLEQDGWRYDDGRGGPPTGSRTVCECYPYTTLVGTAELGYATDGQRPRYKRKPKSLPVAQWRPLRAAACDELVRRLTRLASADPPLHLDSHPVTRQLVQDPSPLADVDYKHREDLIDAVICAWTAALWYRHGMTHCQVLGPAGPETGPMATIIAPAAADQRCPVRAAPVRQSATRLPTKRSDKSLSARPIRFAI
jgi:predicted RNase H-like nuclease